MHRSQGTGYRTQITGYIVIRGYRVKGWGTTTGYMAQVKGYMIQGIEFREWVQRTGYRLQNTVYKAQGTHGYSL